MNEIILALISLIGAIVTGVLIPYIKSKTTEAQRENIYTLVMLAVQAAEQIYFKPGQGEEKKKHVKKHVIDYLKSRGITLTTEDLNMYIESAVRELNIWQNQFL